VRIAPLRRWGIANEVELGPYDEIGPLFLHAENGRGREVSSLPERPRGSPRVFLAHSAIGSIIGGTLVEADGTFERASSELLSDPNVAVAHMRALAFDCFTLEVRRAPHGGAV
jgi:Protein of unknown function (DUF1203)